jgi:hypothetical protein
MKMDGVHSQRINFLVRVTEKECRYLVSTESRLFSEPFTLSDAAKLAHDQDLAERVEAFVGRFARLQDILGDKLLPLLLTALGEKATSARDNLDKAEKLGLIASADDWMTIRQLRNQMIHEYVEDPSILISALNTANAFVPLMTAAANNMHIEVERRGFS